MTHFRFSSLGACAQTLLMVAVPAVSSISVGGFVVTIFASRAVLALILQGCSESMRTRRHPADVSLLAA